MSDTEKLILLAIGVLIVIKSNTSAQAAAPGGIALGPPTPAPSTPGAAPSVPAGVAGCIINGVFYSITDPNCAGVPIGPNSGTIYGTPGANPLNSATGMYNNPLADPCYQSSLVFDAAQCAGQGRVPYS